MSLGWVLAYSIVAGFGGTVGWWVGHFVMSLLDAWLSGWITGTMWYWRQR